MWTTTNKAHSEKEKSGGPLVPTECGLKNPGACGLPRGPVRPLG